MERNGAIPVPVAMKMVSRSGGRRMKSPNGPWLEMSSPFFMSQRKFDMNPSCTRFRHRAKRLSLPGGDAMEYARVISSPSSLFVLSESHCPGTKPKRGSPRISNSRCLVGSERATERVRRAVKVWNGVIYLIDEECARADALFLRLQSRKREGRGFDRARIGCAIVGAIYSVAMPVVI